MRFPSEFSARWALQACVASGNDDISRAAAGREDRTPGRRQGELPGHQCLDAPCECPAEERQRIGADGLEEHGERVGVGDEVAGEVEVGFEGVPALAGEAAGRGRDVADEAAPVVESDAAGAAWSRRAGTGGPRRGPEARRRGGALRPGARGWRPGRRHWRPAAGAPRAGGGRGRAFVGALDGLDGEGTGEAASRWVAGMRGSGGPPAVEREAAIRRSCPRKTSENALAGCGAGVGVDAGSDGRRDGRLVNCASFCMELLSSLRFGPGGGHVSLGPFLYRGRAASHGRRPAVR